MASNNSPNSLQPPQYSQGIINRKPMILVIGIFVFFIFAVTYIIVASGEREKKAKKDNKQSVTPSLVDTSDVGVILPPLPDNSAIIIPPPPPQPQELKIEKPPEKSAVDQEAEAERRRKRLMYLTAISSKMNLGKKTTAPSTSNNEVSRLQDESNSAESKSLSQSPNYDPAAAIDKENFFKRADTTGAHWLHNHTREAGRLLEIKTGTIIPAVLVAGINSDLPGVMIAQVSQNVYNTSNGKYLLIPQGSKLYGAYDARVTWGQKRLLVAWNRILFPDGSSVTLGSMPGVDMAGHAGLKDKVDNHYFQIFGQALLMSGIMATTAYAVDRQDYEEDLYRRYNDKPRFRDEFITMLAQQMGQASMEVLRRNINIAPTLEIRPGFQFNVVATKDVAFAEPYKPYPGP